MTLGSNVMAVTRRVLLFVQVLICLFVCLFSLWQSCSICIVHMLDFQAPQATFILPSEEEKHVVMNGSLTLREAGRGLSESDL